LGLNPGPELERSLLAGPYHPAFGALVREEVCFRKAAALLEAEGATGRPCRLLCAENDLSLLVGQKKAGLARLIARFPGVTVAVDPSLDPGQMRAEAAERKAKRI
ncbi:MAG: radical SAM protein, partial [Firmicutes bacterium]|nr:radical SAM protein [Bacillota bacterium]